MRSWRLIDSAETGATRGALILSKYEPGGRQGLHRHPHSESAILVLRGSGLHLSDGEPAKQNEGDAIFVPAGGWHGFENDGDSTVVTLHLFGGAANLEEAGLEELAGEELAGLRSAAQLRGGKAVQKVELSSTPEDASLSAGDGWFGLHVRWLLNSETVGANKLTMNVTAFDPGGAHELHRHDGCEEILYIIEGRGTHLSPEGETRVEEGDATFVRANEWHGFRNDGDVVTRVVGCYAGAGSLSDAGYELPSSR